MNVLVLGGDGFMGSHLVDRLVSLNHNVTVLDYFKENISINLEHLRGKVRFISGKFPNNKILDRALKDQDVIYHFISFSDPISSWDYPVAEIKWNLERAIKLFELAAKHSVKKIVFPSSGGSVYGRQKGLIKEDVLPNPFTPYGITKLSTEYFLNYFKERTKIAVDIYRIGNAYGPRQSLFKKQGVIAVWMGKILKGESIQVYGEHNTVRDYVYVEDVTFLMTHSLSDMVSSGTYNIGTGRGVSILRLLDIFQKTINKSFEYEVLSRRTFDNTSVILDSSKLLNFFPNFKFQVLEDKIKDTWIYNSGLYTAKNVSTTTTKRTS